MLVVTLKTLERPTELVKVTGILSKRSETEFEAMIDRRRLDRVCLGVNPLAHHRPRCYKKLSDCDDRRSGQYVRKCRECGSECQGQGTDQ